MSTQEPEEAPEGYTGRAATGVIWNLAEKWVIRITGLITVAILTRMLRPEDFGVVAIALSMLPLIQLLADLGFSAFLMQAKDPDLRTYNTAFWFSLTAGVLLVGALVAAAPLAAMAFATPEAAPVIQVLAPAGLLVAMGAIPLAIMAREMRFREVAIQGVIAGAAGQIAAVVLALTGFGVWALVAQTLVYQFTATVQLWWATKWRPRWMFSRQTLGEMMQFGWKVIGIEFLTLGRTWLENAIIVWALGTTGLGYLSIAQRLITIARELTTSALVPVSVVVFSKIRDTTERLRAGYLRAQGVLYVVVIAIMLVIAVGSPWLIPLFFGDQWGESIVPAQLLALAGVFASGAMDHGLFLGLGKPGIWFGYAAVLQVATVLSTLIAAPHGLVAITIGYLVIEALATLARAELVGRQMEAPWWVIATPLARSLIPTIAAGGAGLLVGSFVEGFHPLVSLVLVGLAIVVVYLPLVRVLVPDVWAELMTMVYKVFRKVGLSRFAPAPQTEEGPEPEEGLGNAAGGGS